MMIVELLVNLLYRFSFLSKFFFYLLYIVVSFFIFIVLIIYVDTGLLEWHNVGIYFEKDTYIFLFERHKREVYYFMLAQQIVVLGFIFYLQRQLKMRTNCQIKQIHIEEIASSWLSYQNLKDNILKEEKQNFTPLKQDNEDKSLEYIKFLNPHLANFWEKISHQFIRYIDKIELDIIIKLMQYLDENPKTPSVVSYCSNDSNQKYKIEKITSDGKSSYDILAKVSLCEHSVGVAEKILELNPNQSLLYGKMIIVALAHDIGKIINHSIQSKNKNLFIENSHQHISYIYLKEKFSSYAHIEEISKVVKAHHDSKVTSGKFETLTKFLIEADKERRNDEINEYYQKNPKAKPFENEEEVKKEDKLDEILKDFEGLGVLIDERKEKKSKGEKRILSDEKEVEFDFINYEEQIFQNLATKINQSVYYGYESFIESVSYRDMILFSKQCVSKVLKEITNDENILIDFVRFYREKKYIAYIDIDKGFYSSKFTLFHKDKELEFNCIPIFAKVFKIEVQDLELSKKQDEFLKHIIIKLKKEGNDE